MLKKQRFFLIGQLAKNANFPQTLISGKNLLILAYKEIMKAYEVVGGKIILVECNDDPYHRKFYEDDDFRIFDKSENGLLQYIRKLQDIAALLS